MITKTFPSSSSSAVYTASYDPATGKGTCNCPGWTKRAIRECKHTKALAGLHGSPAPAATSAPVQTTGPDVKPMLASAMKDGATIADFTDAGWVLEEKFDGHRITAIVRDGRVSAWSRPGSEKPAQLRALPAGLAAELAQLPAGTYDGELCIPGGTSSDVVRLDRQNELVYVLFDVTSVLGQDVTGLPLSDRRKALETAFAHIAAPRRVAIASQVPVSLETVKAIWARGGEGAILKRLSSTYRSGWRTPDWVKVKACGSTEMTIVGFEAGKNGPSSVFVLRHDDGRTTTAKVLTDELIRQTNADPKRFIGRRVTMSFMGRTSSGLWRHPQFDHFL